MKNLNLTTKLLMFISFFIFATAIAQQSPGYTLYSIKNSTTTQLIDTNSNVYHT